MRSWSTLFSVLFFLFPSAVHASEFYVTSVIRDFPMKNGDSTYKDFYVNAGTNNGLKKGVFLNATRKIAVFDNINSKMSGGTAQATWVT